MLFKKYKQVKEENENLKLLHAKNKKDIFLIGTLFGALLTLISFISYKGKPIEKIKYNAFNLKEKMTKRIMDPLGKVEDQVEEILEEIKINEK